MRELCASHPNNVVFRDVLIQIIDDTETPTDASGAGDEGEVVIDLALKAIDNLIKVGAVVWPHVATYHQPSK